MPIGFWSTYSTWLIRSRFPESLRKVPGAEPVWFICRNSAGYRISPTSEDFPLPLTPVTTVRTPRGNLTSTSFRLCSMAPSTVIEYTGVRFSRTYLDLCPDRYCRVSDLSICSWLICGPSRPSKTICPPFTPAFGPISMSRSAALMISSSCSTTTTVFPMSRSFLSTDMSLSVSRGCRPMLGSSSIYIDPTRELPRAVTRFILWLSPPDNVFEVLFSVR